MDVSAHFSALDDEEFFVVEGSGWRGRRESDSQVFCHPIDKVVDVPVIISDMFLLFEVPQFQFIDRVVDIPVL